MIKLDGASEELNKSGIYFIKNNSIIFYVLDYYNKDFREALSEDNRQFSVKLRKYRNNLEDKLNNIIGFIINNKKQDYKVFKTKRIEKDRSGSRCDQAVKKDLIDILNNILGNNIYTKENTKNITKEQICFLQEFYLRYYNYIKKNDKIWFITESEENIIFN